MNIYFLKMLTFIYLGEKMENGIFIFIFRFVLYWLILYVRHVFVKYKWLFHNIITFGGSEPKLGGLRED